MVLGPDRPAHQTIVQYRRGTTASEWATLLRNLWDRLRRSRRSRTELLTKTRRSTGSLASRPELAGATSDRQARLLQVRKGQSGCCLGRSPCPARRASQKAAEPTNSGP